MEIKQMKQVMFEEANGCVGRVLKEIERKSPTMSVMDKLELKTKVGDIIHNSRRIIIKMVEEGNGETRFDAQ